jgi:drug/metabolite transporter (DMT)-like permease
MTNVDLSHRAKLLLSFAAVYLIWGSSYLATSIGVKNLPPFLFGGIRFLVAGLILTAIALLLGRRIILDRAELKHLALVALGSVFISNGCNVWGMQWVASNQTALLNATSALWIALLATRGRRAHPLTPGIAAGLVIGFLGAALVIWPRGDLQSTYLFEQAVILVGVLGWAFATVYMRNADSKLDILSFTALQMLIGGCMLIPVGLAAGEAALWRWNSAGLASMAYLTVASSCIAYTAYAWLAQNTSPGAVGTYGYVNPAIAALLGWVFLHERLTGWQIAGMAIMLCGVALVSWPRRESAPEPPG